MRAFVTGATGFLGQSLVRQLLIGGYEVVALVRSLEKAEGIGRLGVELVEGNITDSVTMRSAMEGVDLVCHMADWYRIGAVDWQVAERINVGGSRKVLQLAYELAIPKIIYVSSLVVLGDTKGVHADESYQQTGGFRTEYDRTKWLAHYKVALPLIKVGAPIIIVMPGGLYGPEDPSLIGEMMRRFYLGHIPILPGPEFTLTYAHVDDVAEGILLAVAKGKIGESYILAGPKVKLGEMIEYWARITRKPAPFLRIPARYIRPFVPVVDALSHFIPISGIYSSEAMDILDITYAGRADKAYRELGWQPRSIQQGMWETFNYLNDNPPKQLPLTSVQKGTMVVGIGLLVGLVVGAGVALFKRIFHFDKQN